MASVRTIAARLGLILHGNFATHQPCRFCGLWSISCRQYPSSSNVSFRTLYSRSANLSESKDDKSKVATKDYFKILDERNKKTFLMSINYFYEKSAHRRGHVDFIRSAMRYMEEFGVSKDLEAYKNLMDVLPKGKFVPMNVVQMESYHYPRQTDVAVELLDKMEANAVIPDEEMEQMLVNIFGKWGHPVRKMRRMLYWMSKFRNLSPWPLPHVLPNDNIALAILALKRITSIDLQTQVDVLQASELIDSLDDTWIVSAQSPSQQRLLEDHPRNTPLFIEGPYRVWLRSASIAYFMLRSERDAYPTLEEDDQDPDDVGNIEVPFYCAPKKQKKMQLASQEAIHLQDDGVFLGFCATGTSSRDSLLSWVRFLEKTNPALGEISVVFKQRAFTEEVISMVEGGKSSSETQVTS